MDEAASATCLWGVCSPCLGAAVDAGVLRALAPTGVMAHAGLWTSGNLFRRWQGRAVLRSRRCWCTSSRRASG